MDFEHLPQYELLQHHPISDIRSEGYLLRHKKSGARILLLANDDNNKVFNIAFRTIPKDSTGVAHITEHTVLCGSREFPLKDPFVELVKGSLNTFLNAMTYPDKTMYPVASCNDQDFKNLMHVYLDAVFYPNIYQHEEIFRQEGWHYELESADGELTYNGVVYNEMKGAFSSPEDVLEREIMNSLFPDTIYGVESGGDPVYIPDLTYEAFLDFHRTYYHPSNSYIYLYGNMDMEERLQWLDEHYLSHFDVIPVDSEIALQKPFEQPHRISCTYPVSEEEELQDNTYLTWNAAIGTSLDVELCNAFAILEYALVSAQGAVLKEALLAEHIGKDIMSSYDSGTLQPVFSIIAKNANGEDLDRFLQVIRETLEKTVKEGIDRKALLAGINMMEFRYREADYGSYPKGLIYGIDLFDSWLYDEKRPFDYLEQLDVYKTLREKVETGYYEELIRTWLLDNPHVSVLTAEPDPGKTRREDERLAKLLAEKKAGLTEEEKETLIKNTHALRAYQDTPDSEENLKKLPMLSREDIGKEALPFVNREVTILDTPVLLHDLYTNGIAYLECLFDCTDIPLEKVPYLGVLKAVLGMVDTEQYSYRDLNNEIGGNTGGIVPGLTVFPIVPGPDNMKTCFGIQAKVLYDKLPFAMNMIHEILFCSRIEDDRRLYDILARLQSRLSMQLNASGHSAAAVRSLSYHSPVHAFNDAVSGIRFCRFVEDLTIRFEETKEDLKEELRELASKLFSKERLMLSVTMDGDGFEAQKDCLAGFIRRCPSYLKTLEWEAGTESAADRENALSDTEAELPFRSLPEGFSEGFTTPGQVQYVARSGNFCREGYSYTGALRILKVIMGYEYLWMNIRVKGGAYGCMSSFGRTGNTYFVSYRDPHLKKTNRIYEGIPEYLEQFTVTDRDMTKYIIGTVSDLDIPLTPQAAGSRSLHAYVSGITDEMVQRERDEILQADQQSIRALAPLVRSVLSQNYLCVVGNEDKIAKEPDMFKTIEKFVV